MLYSKREPNDGGLGKQPQHATHCIASEANFCVLKHYCTTPSSSVRRRQQASATTAQAILSTMNCPFFGRLPCARAPVKHLYFARAHFRVLRWHRRLLAICFQAPLLDELVYFTRSPRVGTDPSRRAVWRGMFHKLSAELPHATLPGDFDAALAPAVFYPARAPLHRVTRRPTRTMTTPHNHDPR